MDHMRSLLDSALSQHPELCPDAAAYLLQSCVDQLSNFTYHNDCETTAHVLRASASWQALRRALEMLLSALRQYDSLESVSVVAESELDLAIQHRQQLHHQQQQHNEECREELLCLSDRLAQLEHDHRMDVRRIQAEREEYDIIKKKQNAGKVGQPLSRRIITPSVSQTTTRTPDTTTTNNNNNDGEDEEKNQQRFHMPVEVTRRTRLLRKERLWREIEVLQDRLKVVTESIEEEGEEEGRSVVSRSPPASGLSPSTALTSSLSLLLLGQKNKNKNRDEMGGSGIENGSVMTYFVGSHSSAQMNKM
eukprot:PhM_4_TR6503/c0_g1_i1/m.58475